MKIMKSVRHRMINFNLWPMRREIVAQFGPARLFRYLDGRHELIGGTEDHRAIAREWCSLFAPEIVFSGCPVSRTSRLQQTR
jgi:hypothetical protein